MHVIKFAWKITSRFPRFPFQLINKAICSIFTIMAPTVKANDPVIDSIGKVTMTLYLLTASDDGLLAMFKLLNFVKFLSGKSAK